MRHTFTTKRPKSSGYALWRLFLYVYFYALLLFIFYHFSPLRISLGSMLILLICFFIQRAFYYNEHSFINQITIDTGTGHIFFTIYKPGSGIKEYKRSFDDLKIKLEQYRWPKIARKPVIYFFRKKPGDLFLSAEKDGFSRQDMKAIVTLLESITHPVKR
ncbi:MAG: hypothetical protein NTW29_16000 [Bacteroidetes bacterium]|nr:hypothetical protein [Bacteroidota bacterium]